MLSSDLCEYYRCTSFVLLLGFQLQLTFEWQGFALCRSTCVWIFFNSTHCSVTQSMVGWFHSLSGGSFLGASAGPGSVFLGVELSEWGLMGSWLLEDGQKVLLLFWHFALAERTIWGPHKLEEKTQQQTQHSSSGQGGEVTHQSCTIFLHFQYLPELSPPCKLVEWNP